MSHEKVVNNTIHTAKALVYKKESELLFLVTHEQYTNQYSFPGGA